MISKPRVTFVRHAMPVVDETVPSSQWPLSEEGRLAARGLAALLHLSADDWVLSSAEVKARETAEVLSQHVDVDPRLGEVKRPWISDNYRRLAETWLQGGPVEGWEAKPSAVDRMASAVTEATQKGDHSVCLVTHGLIMSAYLETVADIEPVTFWSQLQFPDARTLDPRTRQVHKP
ncbi:MAG: histidine phosphatase family protein [Actinomycetota bacterium]